jgi:hypothetical protein
MRITRTMPDDGWVPVANAAARDHRLSWRARGLLLELLSYPDGWETTVQKLVDLGRRARKQGGHAEGRDALYGAMAELAKFGYVVYVRRRDEDRHWVTEIEVSDAPRLPEKPESANQESADTESGSPESASQVGTKNTDTKTDTKTDRKDHQGSDQSSTDSGRFAPSIGGVEDSFVEVDREPAKPTQRLSEARANDREMFRELVGDKIRSDGSKFTEGTFRWDQFYDAFRKWKRPEAEPIRWPGTFVRAIAEESPDGGPADWLMNYGLEAA